MDTKEKLDQLAEFEKQRDSIEAEKRTLLDSVEIPAEVEAIIKDGMRRMAEAEKSFHPEADAFTAQIKAELDAVVIPEEIKAQLAEIDQKRSEILARHQEHRDSVSKRLTAMRDAIQYEVEDKTKDVYAALAQRKAEIEAEFAGKENAVDENIKKLEKEIKEDVKALHYTVNGQYLQAVYVKGKKTWIPQRLEAYTETHPDIKECYTVGDPSVTIRKV